MNQVGQTATDSYPEAVVTRCLDPLGQLWTWSRPPLNPRVRPCPLHARSRGKPRVPTVTRGQEPASIAWADAGHSPWSLSLPRRGSVLLDNLGRIRRVKAKPAYAGTSQVDLEIPHSESPEARPEVRKRGPGPATRRDSRDRTQFMRSAAGGTAGKEEISTAIRAMHVAPRQRSSSHNGLPEHVRYVYGQQPRRNTYAARIARRNAQGWRRPPAA